MWQRYHLPNSLDETLDLLDRYGSTCRILAGGTDLILELERGALIVHLGMSGALSIVAAATPPGKHDHLDMAIEGGTVLRLTDPRRFGSVHLVAGDPEQHSLLSALGPEPLSADFMTDGFALALKRSTQSVKVKLLDQCLVASRDDFFRSARHERQVRGLLAKHRSLVKHPLHGPAGQSDQHPFRDDAIEPEIHRDDG